MDEASEMSRAAVYAIADLMKEESLYAGRRHFDNYFLLDTSNTFCYAFLGPKPPRLAAGTFTQPALTFWQRRSLGSVARRLKEATLSHPIAI